MSKYPEIIKDTNPDFNNTNIYDEFVDNKVIRRVEIKVRDPNEVSKEFGMHWTALADADNIKRQIMRECFHIIEMSHEYFGKFRFRSSIDGYVLIPESEFMVENFLNCAYLFEKTLSRYYGNNFIKLELARKRSELNFENEILNRKEACLAEAKKIEEEDRTDWLLAEEEIRSLIKASRKVKIPFMLCNLSNILIKGNDPRIYIDGLTDSGDYYIMYRMSRKLSGHSYMDCQAYNQFFRLELILDNDNEPTVSDFINNGFVESHGKKYKLDEYIKTLKH